MAVELQSLQFHELERILAEIEEDVERSAVEGRVDTDGILRASAELVDVVANAFELVTIRVGPTTAAREETPVHRVEHGGKLDGLIQTFWEKGRARAKIEVKLLSKAVRRAEPASVDLTVRVYRFERGRMRHIASHAWKYDPGLRGLLSPQTSFATSFNVKVVESIWDNNWLLNAIRDALASIFRTILELAGAERYAWLVGRIASIATVETLRTILKRLFDLQEGFYIATYSGNVYWPPGPLAIEKFSISGPIYGVAVAVKTSGIIPAIAERIVGRDRWRRHFLHYAKQLGQALYKRIRWQAKTTTVKVGPSARMVALLPDIVMRV